ALLAAREDIRVVSLCLPPLPRFDYAMQALQAGRHVMLEKPPGATLAECHALSRVADAAGLTLYATWHSRHADMVPAAREWLADKVLRKLTITWKEDVRRWHPGQAWIWEPGGLGVFDPGINAFSILTEILPGDIHVTEALLEVPENCQMPIAAEVRFHYPGGADISAYLDFRKEGDQIWDIEAVTDQGTLRLSEGAARMEIEGVVSGEAGALSGEYPRLYDRMARFVQQGGGEVDLRPMTLVADALALGRRTAVAPFYDTPDDRT
ncbi:MAG: Gfo/Idh/MocA family oxidoreductase, partial [Sulfitobacter sp.]|nr:Gfo/Idh/MocA family oxidoreductase [Sulfitobacter sp.]